MQNQPVLIIVQFVSFVVKKKKNRSGGVLSVTIESRLNGIWICRMGQICVDGHTM